MNLNQVTIPVLNVVSSIPFYQALGLKLIVHTHDKYARFECSPNGSTLSLHQVDVLSEGPRVTIYFERDDLDDYVKQLVAKGIEFEQMPTDQRYLWREAKLYDLDSNPIIIYKAGENRINPPWKIK
ncbi:MAG: VOC family protein [Saprospiraceae bacterium]|nr:VOC family protein [Saprospiraceae bacterium]